MPGRPLAAALIASLALPTLLAAGVIGAAPSAPQRPAAAAASATASDAAAPAAPHWPLGLSSRWLTGNFMEPRSGRFHAGLDLKTNSRTGYPVHAVRAGWILRLRVAPGGYGKAVYLRGADGRTYVYGHLQRLADPLRARVRRAQERHGRYAVDLWLEPRELPVRRGEVLALSGQSGSLGPHLHFEVRGRDNQPRDPQALGFAVRDTMAPEILALRVVNLADAGPPSLVQGDGERPLEGELPTVRCGHGRIRLSARLVERSDHLRYRLGPHHVELRVAGEPVLIARNDSLRWEHNRHQRLEYVTTELGAERWLWTDPRSALSGRHTDAWLTRPAWPAGRHRCELVVRDRAGNTSRVRWTLVVADPPGTAGTGEDAGWGGWPAGPDVRRDRWQVDLSAPQLVRGQGPGLLQWACAPLKAEVTVPPERLTGLVPLAVPVQYRADARRPLLRDPQVRLPAAARPDSATLADPAVALYRLADDGWDRVGPVAADGMATLAGPGVHAVLRDTAAPVIATAAAETELRRAPPRRRHGITLPRWPRLAVPVGDHGSGVDWSTVAVTLGTTTLRAEPDPPRDRILVELPDGTAPGAARLGVRVADHAGHEAAAELVLTLRDAAESGPSAAP